MVRLGLYWRMG